MTRTSYRTDPITEALCEFQFGGDPPANLARAQAMIDSPQRGAHFGGAVHQQQIRTMSLVLPLADQGSPAVSVEDSGKRLRAISADQRRLFMVGANALSVHVLKPYPGWEVFHSLIDEVSGIYRSLGDPCPEVHRIGLRYINRVTLPVGADATDFFATAPRSLAGIGIPRRGFVQRMEHHDGGERHCVVGIAVQDDPAGAELVLDIDVILTPMVPLSLEDAVGRTESLKVIEREAFEGSITDAMRRLLDAGGP